MSKDVLTPEDIVKMKFADLRPGISVEYPSILDAEVGVGVFSRVMAGNFPEIVDPQEQIYFDPTNFETYMGIRGTLLATMRDGRVGSTHLLQGFRNVKLTLGTPQLDNPRTDPEQVDSSLWPIVSATALVGRDGDAIRQTSGRIDFQMHPDTYQNDDPDLDGRGVVLRVLGVDVDEIVGAIRDIVEPSRNRANKAKAQAMKGAFSAGSPGLGRHS